MIGEYFSKVKAYLIISPVIKSYTINKEFVKELEGYIRIKAILKNEDLLEILIYARINGDLKTGKYSFHWQNKDKKLIKRWDNAPHHQELETFPDHLHKGEAVYPHHTITFFQVLEYLEEKLG